MAGRDHVERRRHRHPPARGRRRAARRRAADRPRRDRRARASATLPQHVAVLGPLPGVRGPGAAAAPPPARLGARRCGSSASGPPTCWPWRPSTRRFPILLETSRECLQDVFDVPALREVLGRAAQPRRSGWSASTRRRRRRSPRACCSTGSPPTCTRATRRWPSGGPRRWPSTATCCASCSAPRSCASCSTRACWPTSSSSCSASSTGAGPASADELHDLLRALGDLSPSTRLDLRSRQGAAAAALARRSWSPSGGPSPCAIGRRGARRRGRGRGPLPRRARLRRCPLGLPGGVHRPGATPARGARRPLRPHPRPFLDRRGRPPLRRRRSSASPARCGALEADGPPGAGRVPARRRRAGVVRRRRAAPAAPALAGRAAPARSSRSTPAALARFLPAWQGIGAGRRRGLDGLVEALGLLQGAAVVGVDAGARRAAGPRAAATGRPTSTRCARRGDLVWVGAGALGAERRPGPARASATRLPLLARGGRGRRAARRAAARRPPRRTSQQRGASFWTPARAAAAPGAADDRRAAGAPCGTWCGPARSPTTRWRRCGRSSGGGRAGGPVAAPRPGAPAAGPGPGGSPGIGPPAGAGRWSLSRRCSSRPPTPDRGGPRPGPAAARAPRRAHPRGGAGRGRRGRLRRRLPAC